VAVPILSGDHQFHAGFAGTGSIARIHDRSSFRGS
jgi:hypothetical protein